MPLTPAQRTLRARMAAHAMHARNDPRKITAAATAARWNRFENEADPDKVLPPAERRRRAEHLQQAYMTGLALKSSRARRRTDAAATATA
jgi:hypothetical protein